MTGSAPIARAGKIAGVGWVVMAVALALAVHDLANSNRPHELTKMPYAMGLAAVGVVLCGFVVVAMARAWRARREAPLRAPDLVAWGLAVTYVLMFVGYGAFFVVAAVTSWRG